MRGELKVNKAVSPFMIMERKWSAPANRPKIFIRIVTVVLLLLLFASSIYYYNVNNSSGVLAVIFLIAASIGYMLMKLRFFANYTDHVIVINPQTLIIDELDSWNYQITPQPLILPLVDIREVGYRPFGHTVHGITKGNILLNAIIGKRKIEFGANFQVADLKEIALTLSGSTYLSPDLQRLVGISQAPKNTVEVDDILNYAVDKFKDYLKKR